MRVPKKSVNAFEALRDYNFQVDLLRAFGTNERHFSEALETMDSLVQGLGNLQEITDNDAATTKEMFDAVLQMPGVKLAYNARAGRSVREETTFAGELSVSAKDYGADDDDAPPDSTPNEGEIRLGNIGFLYELAKPDPQDPADVAQPPTSPKGFFAKMGRLTDKAKELRIDLDEWNSKQKEKAPEDREKPPGVYLGTIHSTKGAQWENVVLQMPGGRFPLLKKRKEGEETEDTIAEDARKLESERRLAYVAMTRPKKNLRVVAPAEYNGRPAGLSMFVSEAGLSVGENVQQPAASTEAVKTASHFVEDYEDGWYATAGGF
jgi:superfamily I DNA/RNA helicase